MIRVQLFSVTLKQRGHLHQDGTTLVLMICFCQSILNKPSLKPSLKPITVTTATIIIPLLPSTVTILPTDVRRFIGAYHLDLWSFGKCCTNIVCGRALKN